MPRNRGKINGIFHIVIFSNKNWFCHARTWFLFLSYQFLYPSPYLVYFANRLGNLFLLFFLTSKCSIQTVQHAHIIAAAEECFADDCD